MAAEADSPDYYALIGVGRGATQQEIATAFRSKARVTHPDKLPPGASEEEKEQAKIRFQKLVAAYEVLHDTEKRNLYDLHRRPSRDLARALKRELAARASRGNRPRVRAHASAMLRAISDVKALKDQVHVIERVVRAMAAVSWALHQSGHGMGWYSTWKSFSHCGYDWIGMRKVDYGNEEYASVLDMWSLASEELSCTLRYLCQWWPSLEPCARSRTNHACEQFADVVEIAMAALRAFRRDLFNEIQDGELINAFATMCKGLRAYHTLMAGMSTGTIKYKNYARWSRMWYITDEQGNEFKSRWAGEVNSRGSLLFDLVESD